MSFQPTRGIFSTVIQSLTGLNLNITLDPIALYELLKKKEQGNVTLLASEPHHPYQDRPEDVQNLTKKFNELSSKPYNGAVSVYIQGGPGSGKAQLAREYGKSYAKSQNKAAKGKRVVIATLDARSPSRFWRSYVRLAIQLECPILGSHDTLDVISSLVQRKLSEHPNWLLIVEGVNAESK